MRDLHATAFEFDDGGVASLEADDLDALDPMDRARLLPAFLGVKSAAGSLHYVPRPRDGVAPAYAFDEETGMVYILD